jgi:xanthine dehydrogenase accessory factor
MALRDDGSVVGSVSGGCVEDDLVQRLVGDPLSWQRPGAPACTFMRYGVTSEDAHRFGLPCGGTLELLAEFNPAAEPLCAMVDELLAGRLVRRTVRLADGALSLATHVRSQPLQVDDHTLAQTFGPGHRLLLIGAGQLAEYLATMALFNGFAVTVCDPRREYSVSWRVPGVQVVTDMPDDAVLAFRPDRSSAVIALSHDPKLDDLALIDALATDAMYVGAIGSRRNSEARRARLVEHFGIGPEAIARLRGPIGLYIGSKTPAEIAVSVMAEVLAVKNGVQLGAGSGVADAKAERDLALAAG